MTGRRLAEPTPPRGRLRDADDETLTGVGLLLLIGSFVSWRLASRHPWLLAGAACAAVLACCVGGWARARLRDRRAARWDPPGPGVIIGSVRGDWWLARRRRFVLPWTAFNQHVLIDGPTGRGKTFTFVVPLLRANVARGNTGVFYLDGKGDRIDRGDGDRPGVAFDHVFCPEDPSGSARWNPLGGADPIQAARDFAAALFPEAAQAGANFYEARAVFAITRVAPAMALTGFGLDPGDSSWNRRETILPRSRVFGSQRRGMGSARRCAGCFPTRRDNRRACAPRAPGAAPPRPAQPAGAQDPGPADRRGSRGSLRRRAALRRRLRRDRCGYRPALPVDRSGR